MKISVATQPYTAEGKGIGGGAGPKALLDSGLIDELQSQGHSVDKQVSVALTDEEEQAYGGWNRVASANAHLADCVAEEVSRSDLLLGLYANCNSLLGTLGGLARSEDPSWPRRVGLVWIDAHADYNTPETTPSGMLGGMPVAVACGKCLIRLRKGSGLRVPLQQPDLFMIGLRDVDPAEAKALDADGIVTLQLEDLIEGSQRLQWAMDNLSAREDLIYVHVDLDILDPGLAPAAGLPTPGGVSGEQLGEGLNHLLRLPKVKALGLVSYQADRDDTGETLAQVKDAIVGATAS